MNNWVPNKKINHNIVSKYLIATENSGQFTNYGPNTRLLEERIREKFKVNDDKAIIAVTNGTVAIQILAEAVNNGQRDFKWGTQSFTFPPSSQGNLKNVEIIDIDEDGGLDLKYVPDNIDGIIVTNIFGNVVDIAKYELWAKKHNKILLFDNAATCYTFYNGKNCVNYGTGCSISFHHTKPFGFGEGGAIIIDKMYEHTVRCLINFGIGFSNENYYLKEGINGKMSDISAVYILQYLDTQFDNIINIHNNLYMYMKHKITNNNFEFTLFPSFHDDTQITPACLSLIFNSNIHTEEYMTKLSDNGIISRKYYHPLRNTSRALYIYNHIVCIPCTIEMTCLDIDTILQILSN